ncbi:MAG: class I SAM-dependent methyltransferase [Rhodospirillaceae bacterium]
MSDAAALTFQFTQDWFVQNVVIWDKIVPRYKPQRILEIGSYEGRSACYFIEKFAAQHPIELHCVDSWQGGVEHNANAMSAVEKRFDYNVALAQRRAAHPVKLIKHKSLSHPALAKLIVVNPAPVFDVIYIDGSHQAPDVLTDAVMAFQLLRVGGLMVFDDYLWSMEDLGKQDSFNMPKPAVDAFINIFQRKMFVVRGAPVYQLFATKAFA